MSERMVIRGGTVVDGSGVPGRVADVAIEGGRIVEVGPDLQGDTTVDQAASRAAAWRASGLAAARSASKAATRAS